MSHNYRDRLIALYKYYDPDKLERVESQLVKYEGSEEALIQAVVNKYGPEPGDTFSSSESKTEFRQRLINFYQVYLPSNVGSVDAQLKKYKDREEALFQALVNKYGPEPDYDNKTASCYSEESDYRARIVAIYEAYAPNKVNGVDAQLEKYRGREEDLIAALVSKYGPEPQQSEASKMDYRSRVIAIYEQYAPSKISSVDGQLEKYRGQEEALIEALERKYIHGGGSSAASTRASECVAPNPDAVLDYRTRIIALYEAYAPNKVNGVDAQLEKYRGREEDLIAALVSKYGPEPQQSEASKMDYRSRVIAIYEQYAPSKISSVDGQLEKYRGQEEALIEALERKYIHGSGSSAASTRASECVAPNPDAVLDYRTRIIALYEAYAPNKVNGVDAQLEKYRGREEDLIAALVSKYGPEPQQSEASKMDYRSRVIAIYEQYAPSKISSVDGQLEKYRGQEEALIEALERKYIHGSGSSAASTRASECASPNPGAVLDYRTRIIALYEAYAPNKVNGVDAQLEKYRGREEDLIAALVSKYGPEPQQSEASKMDYRSRVIAIYEQYAPNKISSVDGQLEKYRGQEEALIEALERKYIHGSGSSAASTRASECASPNPGAVLDYRTRIIALYEAYAPNKVNGVDAQLEKYRGREEDLIAALVSKYGPEPQQSEASKMDYRSRVIAIYEQYAPSKISSVDGQLEKYRGQEEALIEALERKYIHGSGSSAASTRASECVAPNPGAVLDYRTRIIALYEAYAPNKVNGVDAQLEKYRGREEDLIAALVSKYGPEPQQSEASKMDYRSRVIAIYEQYAPNKISSVDGQLEKYRGQEEALIEALERKYIHGSGSSAASTRASECVAPSMTDVNFEKCAKDMFEKVIEMFTGYEMFFRAVLLDSCDDYLILLCQLEETVLRGEIYRQTSKAHMMLFEEGYRVGLEMEEFSVRPVLEIPARPFEGANAIILAEFFAALGTINIDGVCYIDAPAYRILLSYVSPKDSETDTMDSDSSTLVSLEAFRSKLTSICYNEAAMVARMTEFIAMSRKKVHPQRLTSYRDLSVGFWAFKCLKPCVVEKWERTWVSLEDDARLVLRRPNVKSPDLTIELNRILNCRLASMLGTSAPRASAKNGLYLQLSEGPNPILVLMCPEQADRAHALVRLLRRDGASGTAETSDDIPDMEWTDHVQNGGGLQTTTVWCCRSGRNSYVRSTWSLAGSHIIHRVEGEKRNYTWSLSTVRDVYISQNLAVKPPTGASSKFGFVVVHDEGSLLCCAESLCARDSLLGAIKRVLFKLSLTREGAHAPVVGCQTNSPVSTAHRIPGIAH